MKRILEFICMALGIPWIHWALLIIAGFIIALFFMGCTEVIDRINGLPSDDRINDQYSHVSDSAPEALKPFYDADLTRKLNE